jgi:putative PIG3 family NAD(P)H quinone oxidoreductase
MKGIVVHRSAEGIDLSWEEVPDVAAGPEEALVEVKATAVNRADLLQARGKYPPPKGASEILGLEIAGTILEIGSLVTDRKPGDRVCALLPGGGYAEKAAVHVGLLLPLPEGMPFNLGAAIPEVWLTAFLNLFNEGNLRPGETVLIHAGGSGVGTAAIQLAREAGAIVTATAGSDVKIEKCTELGAALAVNYRERDFAAEVASATRGEGVDLILDPVGASYFERNLKLLKEGGRLVSIGLLGGTKSAIDLGTLLGKSLRLIGSRLRSRPLREKIELTRAFRERFWHLFASGRLRPVVDSVYPIAEAGAAHEYIASNRNLGKVVLEIAKD